MCKKQEMQILALLLWGKPVIFSSQTIQLKHETQKKSRRTKKENSNGWLTLVYFLIWKSETMHSGSSYYNFKIMAPVDEETQNKLEYYITV